jgi:O-methyltransferase
MKFDMSISQLNFIIDSMKKVKGRGVVLEIGVGGGATAVMMNLAMDKSIQKREYVAIDTFDGFTNEDIYFEQKFRGKKSNFEYYQSNSKSWFQKTLIAHGITDALVIKSDCKTFNYEKIGPIAFCLFDVDLYLPTKEVLPMLYQQLIPGGMIVVDDCDPLHPIYDGAGQAYREFCDHVGLEPSIVFEKLGVIRKPD